MVVVVEQRTGGVVVTPPQFRSVPLRNIVKARTAYPADENFPLIRRQVRHGNLNQLATYPGRQIYGSSLDVLGFSTLDATNYSRRP